MLPAGAPEWQRKLVTDPQTSGGLLISVSSDAADSVLAQLRDAGFARAAIIGEMRDGLPRVDVV